MSDGSAFRGMADRIEGIAEGEFAGAVVIVPPGEGLGIEFCTSDPRPDLVQFWASVKARIEIAYAEAMAAAEKSRGGWG